MSYLILVRHGQSIWNLENRFTGWVDIDLNDTQVHSIKIWINIKLDNTQAEWIPYPCYFII